MKRVQLQAVQPTGQAQAFASLGQRLSQHYGQAAGAVSNLVESKHREHVKTVLDGYEAQMDRDLRLGLGELAAKHPNDLQAFNEQAEALVSTTLQGVDPEYLQQFESKARGLQTAYQSQVQTNAINMARKDMHQTMQTAAEQSLADGMRLMRQGLGDEQSALEAAQAQIDYHRHIDTQVKAGFITSTQGEEFKRIGDRQLSEEAHLSQVDPSMGVDVETAQQRLDEMDARQPDGWTPDEWQAVINKGQLLINKARAKQQAEAGANKTQAMQAARTYRDSQVNGYDVSPQEKKRVDTLVSQFPEAVAIVAQGDEVASFSVLPFNEMSEQIELANDGTLEGYERQSILTAQASNITKLYQTDGYNTGVKQGLVDFVPLTNAASFAERGSQALILSDHTGFAVAPFTPQEVGGMVAELNTDYGAAVNILASVEQMPQEIRMAAYGQLAGKGQGGLAVVGSMGDSSMTQAFINGKQRMQLQELPFTVNRDDLMSHVSTTIGAAYEPENQAGILDAAMAIAADDTSLTSADDYSERVLQIIDEIAPVATYNGKAYGLPYGVEQDDFESYLEGLSDYDFDAFGGINRGYDIWQFKQAIEDGQIIGVPGGYHIIDTRTGGALPDESGNAMLFRYDISIVDKQARKARLEQYELQQMDMGERFGLPPL